MRALIIEDGLFRGALTACRALARVGWTVGIGSPEPGGFAATSRFAASWHRVPAADPDPQTFLGATRRAITEGGYEIVFATGEGEILALSAARDDLGAVFPYGCHEGVVRALDKVHLADAAERVGFSVPETVSAAEVDLARLDVPVIVKPRLTSVAGPEGGSLRLWAAFARDREAAAEQIAALRRAGAEPLLQRHVPGELSACACVIDRDGRIVAAVDQTARRIWPPFAGGSVRAVTVPPDERLRQRVQALLADLRWFGLAQVQFQRSNAGELFLIDLNGRFYGSMALAVGAGPNLPAVWAALATGRRPPVVPDPWTGMRYHRLEVDLRRALSEPRGGLVRDVAGCLRYAAGAQHGLWDRRDPGPAVRYSGTLALRGLRKLRGR